jgi:hypothetical protein
MTYRGCIIVAVIELVDPWPDRDIGDGVHVYNIQGRKEGRKEDSVKVNVSDPVVDRCTLQQCIVHIQYSTSSDPVFPVTQLSLEHLE